MVETYRKYFNEASLKHILLNYSESEVGRRHPKGPVGYVLRDQGQIDLYAGRTRSILSINGNSLHIARQFSVMSESIGFYVNSISNFRILGRSFNKQLHEGQKILALKDSIMESHAIIGPQTRVDPQTGEIIDRVYLNAVFDDRMIFESNEKLVPADVEAYNYWKGVM